MRHRTIVRSDPIRRVASADDRATSRSLRENDRPKDRPVQGHNARNSDDERPVDRRPGQAQIVRDSDDERPVDRRPGQAQIVRDSDGARPADRRSQLTSRLRRPGRPSEDDTVDESDVRRAGAPPTDISVGTIGADVSNMSKPVDEATRLEPSHDVNVNRNERQERGRFGYFEHSDVDYLAGPRKDSPAGIRGRDTRSRSRRIKEMRALIDQLQNELQARRG